MTRHCATVQYELDFVFFKFMRVKCRLYITVSRATVCDKQVALNRPARHHPQRKVTSPLYSTTTRYSLSHGMERKSDGAQHSPDANAQLAAMGGRVMVRVCLDFFRLSDPHSRQPIQSILDPHSATGHTAGDSNR